MADSRFQQSCEAVLCPELPSALKAVLELGTLGFHRSASDGQARPGGAEIVHRPQAKQLLAILAQNPSQSPPPFEKLVGNLAEAYSRRIDIQHRLVYQVLDRIMTVKVLRM